MKKRDFVYRARVFVLCLLIVVLVSYFGSQFSVSVNSSWYDSIRPAITPPSFVFPIAWGILYFLIALSLYFVWINSKSFANRKQVALVYGANLILNGLWTYLYFGLRNPLSGFIDIILIWISIWLMIFVAYRIDKKAMWLLVPYLLWVSFASVLNFMSI
jgi:tryptophan-rich sensory protein